MSQPWEPAERTDDLTPKEVLAASLAELDPAVTPVVLYTCGSMCPVHRQHIAIQEFAKDMLNSLGLAVVAGYLATSNDIYVRQKYLMAGRMSAFLDYAARASLIEAALADHPFIRLDRWDGESQQQPSYVMAIECRPVALALAQLMPNLPAWQHVNWPLLKAMPGMSLDMPIHRAA